MSIVVPLHSIFELADLPMNTPLIQFVRRGDIVSLRDVPPTRTLLQVLREDLNGPDTKEGCNEGDCGACTVVLGEAQGDRINYRTVNSCIRLAHSIHGMALWTAQDLLAPDGTLHPAQQALVQCHGSQCGFCTPGMLMASKALLTEKPSAREEEIKDALSGHFCRCISHYHIIKAVMAAAGANPPYPPFAKGG